ncbi:hypothetical protein LPW11_11810 [Geomonas sp. RF6]|uniref:hypothetical protein n=1 Tax=Geomonas sp. RF6 TaxID=2897342 RepID=UPI001E2F5608|nr:hypothetical protein [Geomonas sp. RF6]UFS68601.1 hypothetical protein LPW11_11810 [Geomonas sp. RF6]
MNMGMIWGIAKVAARNIPWGRVAQHAPAVFDLVGQAKARRAPRRGEVAEKVLWLEEENERLAAALVETTEQLQTVARTLETVSSRQLLIGTVAAVSLVVGVLSLVIAVVKV